MKTLSDACFKTYERAKEQLQSRFCHEGFYRSHLSSSALSTCLAVYALSLENASDFSSLIEKGLDWLMKHANPDGGWGDTVKSPGNLSTTLLVWSTLFALKGEKEKKASLWLEKKIGNLSAQNIVSHVLDFYGKDRTFSAPILTMCALSGSLGSDIKIWNRIPQLPFELSALPGSFFRIAGLQVVSYAIPALVAIGLVHHRLCPCQNPFLRLVRSSLEKRCLDLLERLQPDSGGFLEAIPLTAFVVMALIKAQVKKNRVVQKGIEFLLSSAREDGSWAIDSNLDTWVTALSVEAFPQEEFLREQKHSIKAWLLKQQFTYRHPFTLSPPGGWGWTNLPGRLPDGDDTSGVLMALHRLYEGDASELPSIEKGISWLLQLQNSDGGMPTFCKGWTRLPFDKSCPDITAHALSALFAWQSIMPAKLQKKISRSISLALSYLQKSQNSDGSWVPLWFGNALSKNMENPVYGTSKVVSALSALTETNDFARILWNKGCKWLFSSQNEDYGWGGQKGIPSSIEESALAIAALSTAKEEYEDSIIKGVEWLNQNTQEGKIFSASPIGLYFAQLWYFEDMYPILFYLSAMQKTLSKE